MKSIIIEQFDLHKNYDSGQVFRWYKVKDGYLAIIGSSAYLLQDLSSCKMKVTRLTESFVDIKRYFDNDRNYDTINKGIVSDNPNLSDVVDYAKGIRILKQDSLEMIITFILSANNNIKRIRNTVEKISEAKGELVINYDGVDYYSFPALSQLKELTEDDFKRFGAGYRANYLFETISRLSDENLKAMENLSTDELVEELKTYKGVGRKVAECIALFGYNRWEVFPVDTWMKKALSHFYGVDDFNEKNLVIKLRDLFADNRALVQQYMFYYMREDGKSDR